MVFEVAAPGLYGEQATRDWRSGYEWWRGECQQYLAAYARDYGLWIAVATQAGRTVDEDFPGGGFLYRPDGECVYETADWSEGVGVCHRKSSQSDRQEQCGGPRGSAALNVIGRGRANGGWPTTKGD